MLSMDDDDGIGLPPILSIRISRTEEQTSLMMQRFTCYVIEVSDFGKTAEVPHRYGDFEALYKSILTDCPGLHLPAMPPKGVDGTDAAVVASRKVELEKILRAMLASAEVLMEPNLHLWKFLNLGNPAIIAGRFCSVPKSRVPPAAGAGSTLMTLAKLIDAKYKDDVYRLGHPAVTTIIVEGLRELRSGDLEGSHWVRQKGGRAALCQLCAGALGTDEATRTRLLEGDAIALLLGIVEREDGALDDARTALNVIVAREAERFPAQLAHFLRRGGVSQLVVLGQRERCQEFVAKLLWLAWDPPVRAIFSQPGGQGLQLLNVLLKSRLATCQMLGAVLIAGLVANGDFDADAGHRSEALKLVRSVLGKPPQEAATDANFIKTLCGASSTLARLAGLLEDADLAPMVLHLLCVAKPPAAKLGRISGNLAALVGDRGSTLHGEETRARAAELLLHIQSTPGVVAAPAGGAGGRGGGAGAAATTASGVVGADLARCEGIADHEDSLDHALKAQLQEGVVRCRGSLEQLAVSVQGCKALAAHRLQALPPPDFQVFDRTFASFKISREALDKSTRESASLHHSMEGQLLELQAARPSAMDPQAYRDRLLGLERMYAGVKTQREAFAAATEELRVASARAEASAEDFRRCTEEARKLEEEVSALRIQHTEKETQATKLRHKANTPSLELMKQQAAQALERNLAQVKELQVIGQRVQQGDPDYLKDGESRDSKIAELGAKLQQLKKQHQQLLQQQKDLDFDPVALGAEASTLELAAEELKARAASLEARRAVAASEKADKTGASVRDSDAAKQAQERKSTLASKVAIAEGEARAELSALQPLIQEHHAGWQRLLALQKKLESDQGALSTRLSDASRASDVEASVRQELGARIDELVGQLTGLKTFLLSVDGAPAGGFVPPPRAVPEAAPTLVAAPTLGGDDLFAAPSAAAPALVAARAPVADPFAAPSAADDLFAAPVSPAAALPAVAAAAALPAVAAVALADPFSEPVSPLASAAVLDDFDAFLREDTDMTFGAAPPAAPASPSAALPVLETGGGGGAAFGDEL